MADITRAAAVRVAAGLGWAQEVVGPVSFGGVRFWGAIRSDPASDGGLLLDGAMVAGPARASTLTAASMLAPYAPRAVVVPDTAAMLDLMVRAAVLDQGLVVMRGDGSLVVLARPGPRTSPARRSMREFALLEHLHAAREVPAREVSGSVGPADMLRGEASFIDSVPTA